jgi:hypothetical protein
MLLPTPVMGTLHKSKTETVARSAEHLLKMAYHFDETLKELGDDDRK